MLWSFSTDKFGRRTILNTCQTLVCLILFVVGGLYWTGASTGNVAAGTGLVRPHPPVALCLYRPKLYLD